MSRSQFAYLMGSVLGLSLVLGLAACNEDGGGLGPIVPAGGLDIPANEFIEGVNRDGVEAPYAAEVLPTGSETAPVLLGSRQYVVGGSIVMQVGVPSDATELLVSVDSASEGYWVVDLSGAMKTTESPRETDENPMGAYLEKVAVTQGPSASQLRAEADYLINLTPSGEPGRTSFRVSVVARTASGLTQKATHTVVQNSTASGSDWLQVSLNWIHPVDMDLHLQTPEGEDIYWANRSGANGGFLDLDSNAACQIDGIQNENIRWLSRAPTPGDYILRLDLWSACDQVEAMPFLITVIIDGEMTLFQGEMSPTEADAGGEFAGRIITTVNVPAGL